MKSTGKNIIKQVRNKIKHSEAMQAILIDLRLPDVLDTIGGIKEYGVDKYLSEEKDASEGLKMSHWEMYF